MKRTVIIIYTPKEQRSREIEILQALFGDCEWKFNELPFSVHADKNKKYFKFSLWVVIDEKQHCRESIE